MKGRIQDAIVEQGRQAYREGKQLDIPYPFGSSEYDDFERGADTELGNYRTLGKCHLARRSLECPERPFTLPQSRHAVEHRSTPVNSRTGVSNHQRHTKKHSTKLDLVQLN